MAEYNTANILANEIVKADDFMFANKEAMSNITRALIELASNKTKNCVIGGKVRQASVGGMNIDVEPIFIYEHTTEAGAVKTEKTGPVSIEIADGAQDRIDTIQVKASYDEYDIQGRRFRDHASGLEVVNDIPTKIRMKIEFAVKRGDNGAAVAPDPDTGWVKIAEIDVGAGISEITDSEINNISALYETQSNDNWTSSKTSVFAITKLAELMAGYLHSHNLAGSHRSNSILASMIKLGIGGDDLSGKIIPAGKVITIAGTDYAATSNLVTLLEGLRDELSSITKAYLSTYEAIPEDIKYATTTNINIATGGLLTIDGKSVAVGNIILVKNQADKKENGLWVAQSGAWNRAAGYTSDYPDAFNGKLFTVKGGDTNSGKVFYIPDNAVIGTRDIEFIETILSVNKTSEKIVYRDNAGRAKIEDPIHDNDIANRNFAKNASNLSTGTLLTARLDNSTVPARTSALSNSNNLNGITMPGFYNQPLTANADVAALNYPIKSAGSLIVLKNNDLGAGSAGITQIYIDHAGNLYKRGSADGSTWTAWKEVAYTDDIIIKDDITVTVTGTEAGDFPTLNAALEYLAKLYPLYKAKGYTCEIKLLAGYVMREQVIVTSIDLGYIIITSEDAEVSVDKTYVTQKGKYCGSIAAFLAEHNAVLPVIGALFRYSVKNKSSHSGIVCYGNSRATILSKKGFKNAGDTGIRALHGSTINAQNADASGAGNTGIYALSSSTINAQNADASGAGDTGIYARRGSTINAHDADASGAGGTGIYALNGSTINAQNADASGAGVYGIRALHGSTINAQNADASGAGEYGIFIYQGSLINAALAKGSIHPGIANNLTSSGIIFM